MSVATSQTSPRYLPWNSRYVFANTHQIPDFHDFPRFYGLRNHPKKKNTQSHFVNELHAFCPFFKAYHMGKHRRGLLHVSYCISSHNFTYIIHIFVYAILIPSLQFSLHLKSKWLKNYSKSLPERRTTSALLNVFCDSCSPWLWLPCGFCF